MHTPVPKVSDAKRVTVATFVAGHWKTGQMPRRKGMGSKSPLNGGRSTYKRNSLRDMEAGYTWCVLQASIWVKEERREGYLMNELRYCWWPKYRDSC